MKKFLFLLMMLVALVSTIFVICGAEEDENITTVITDGGKIVTESISVSVNKVSVSGKTDLVEGETITYVVYKKDANNKATKGNLLEINDTTVNADLTFSFAFGLKAVDISDEFIIEMKALSQSEYARVEMRIESDEALLSAEIAKVEKLISDCEAQGIATDYERVKYATAKKVLNMLPVFRDNGETEAYTYNLDVAHSLCDEAKSALESYLDGSDEPMTVIKPTMEPPQVDGNSFYNESLDKNVYYVGYGHWESSDMELYNDLGANLYHFEIGPSSLLEKAVPATEWDLNEVHTNKINYLIEYSEENGGSVKIPSSDGSGQLWISQTVQVKPNTQYSFGIDFKCTSASSLRLRVGNTDKWFYDNRNDGEISNWKTVSSTYTTGADETEITYSVISHNNSENLYFDNAFLKDTSGNNLLKNGDFSNENTEMFTVNQNVAERIEEFFADAEENGVSVVLMTAMHYFPQYMYNYDSTIVNGDVSKFPTFMPFNPTHPEVIKVIEKFLEELIPLVKDSDALHSIILSNEPMFEVYQYPDYYLNAYYKMLEDKYGAVSEMNKAYGGTTYKNFSDVKMPSSTDRKSSERKKLAHFNDYRLFNESIMTEYHRVIAGKIESIAPKALLHTKGMASLNAIGTSGNRIQLGINNEELSKFLDLNGCDSWAYYGDSKDTLMGKTMWYDYMTSVKNAPVVNSEDHILKDSKTLSRSEKEFNFNMADIWQGAIHGRGATTLWLYDNSARSKNETVYYNANLTRRADYLAQIGKISLDLNRLSGEVSAINNEDARVAILYSDSSLVLNPYALNASYIAYQQVMFGGEKVFFVNEEHPEALNEKNIELLIVPCSNYMKATTLAEIKKHIDNGGRVLLLNANSKSWMDENGNAHDSSVLNSVISRSETASFTYGSDMYAYDTSSNVVNKVKREVAKLDKDISVSSKNSSVEWLVSEYNGDYIINLCNYGNSDTSVTLSAKAGFDIENAVDLISGEKVGAEFNLSVNKPMLLKIENIDGFKFYSINENDEKEEVFALKAGEMSVVAQFSGANPGMEFVYVIAVFESGVLKQTHIETGNADSEGKIISEKEFVIGEDIDLNQCELKAFLFDNMENVRPYMPMRNMTKQ